MNDNDTNTALLIQYLDGELGSDVRAEVESKIAGDPLLKEELEHLRFAQLAIKSYGVRQKVAGIHAEMMKEELTTLQPTKTPLRIMVKRVFSVAASIIIIMGMLSVYEYSTLSSDKLFKANYQSYAVHEMRGEQHSSQLEQLYKQHSMQQVIKKFAEENEPAVDDYFYAGNAYLIEHNPAMAIKTFELLHQKNISMQSHLLEDDAQYYLGMSYLLNNEPRKALPIFNYIHNDQQHLYHDKVGSLFLFKIKLLTSK